MAMPQSFKMFIKWKKQGIKEYIERGLLWKFITADHYLHKHFKNHASVFKIFQTRYQIIIAKEHASSVDIA